MKGDGGPARRGAVLALAAAALFGVSTPLIQRLGRDVDPWLTAALLYAGAAAAGFLLRSSRGKEAPLSRAQLPRILGIALCGAVAGPVLLAWGLKHTGGTGASLILTLEAVFTVALAWLFYRERSGGRVLLALGLMTLGGAALVLGEARGGAAHAMGLLAVLGATVAWGVDNTLSRGVADADPARVVLAKAVLGALASFVTCVLTGSTSISASSLWGLLAVGAVGYGLSLRFYLRAQRSFGAARTGSVFAAAPFLGAVAAFLMGERAVTGALLAGAALMAAGVALHATERHEHEHAHERLEHEHAHTHDDGHHDHRHDPMPQGPHSHAHAHEARTHSHPHAPDLHHAHKH